MSRSFPPKQFRVSSTVNDGLSLRPQLGFSVDSPSLRRFTVADAYHSTPLLLARRTRLGSPVFVNSLRRSLKSPIPPTADNRAAFSPPSIAVLLAEHHHWPRLDKAQPPVRSESAAGDMPETPPPADGNSQHVLLTELTRSTVQINHPLTESTRSTRSTQHFQQPASSIPMPNLPKKSFAEVVAPSRASEIAKTAPHKYFLADSPQTRHRYNFDGRPRSKIAVHRCGDRGLSSSIQIRTRWKIFAWSTFVQHAAQTDGGNWHQKQIHDYTRLWLRRIWYIQGYPMRVFKWTPTFTTSKESINSHLFRKEVLFTVASMIGTPLQIDDATLNQSKLSKARACIELDLLKPRLENFQIQICGATIVQRIEYEDIPHYCSLCKHVGHRDSDCYTEGDASEATPPEAEEGCCGSGAGAKQLFRKLVRVQRRGSSQNSFSLLRTPDNLVVSSVENIVETNLPSDNLVVGVVYPPIGGVDIQMRKKR
ncbi:UNVERIFIED_CONTAM: hypothetical protein Sindi_2927600, partial [Sesamum indicum]